MSSINIPNSVTDIGNYAFYGCESLKEITIPDSVTSIGYGAFKWCFSLSSITFEGRPLEDIQAMNAYPFGLKDPSVIKCEP